MGYMVMEVFCESLVSSVSSVRSWTPDADWDNSKENLEWQTGKQPKERNGIADQ